MTVSALQPCSIAPLSLSAPNRGSPPPLKLMKLCWAEQQRIARQLRQYAREVLCAERHVL